MHYVQQGQLPGFHPLCLAKRKEHGRRGGELSVSVWMKDGFGLVSSGVRWGEVGNGKPLHGCECDTQQHTSPAYYVLWSAVILRLCVACGGRRFVSTPLPSPYRNVAALPPPQHSRRLTSAKPAKRGSTLGKALVAAAGRAREHSGGSDIAGDRPFTLFRQGSSVSNASASAPGDDATPASNGNA